MCLRLSSTKNTVEFYLNGTHKDNLSLDFDVIPGDGTLIIGHEQDGPKVRIDHSSQAFRYNIYSISIIPIKIKLINN